MCVCVVSRQGRVMVKLCVTTDNGLYPLGHAQALASQCKDLSARWILTAGERVSAPPSRPISAASTPGSRPNHAANAAFPASVYAKGDLRARRSKEFIASKAVLEIGKAFHFAAAMKEVGPDRSDHPHKSASGQRCQCSDKCAAQI